MSEIVPEISPESTEANYVSVRTIRLSETNISLSASGFMTIFVTSQRLSGRGFCSKLVPMK